jgi:hypothetical protein
MKAPRQMAAQIARFGQMAQVKVPTETGQNSFGNTENSYADDRKVLAMRTYPNRNTESESNVGERAQDRALFLVPATASDTEPPQYEDRIVFEGTEYEVGAHTTYSSHVEFFGEPIIH